MKTKEKILLTALRLLNEEGEAAVSAVDIANELEISPGNLYYHFKGKDQIIPALLSAFHEELLMVLDVAEHQPADLEQYWIYIYIIFEEIYDFRFFYLNTEHLIRTYPQIKTRVRQILSAKRDTIDLILTGLEETGALDVPEGLHPELRESILMVMMFWLPMQAIDQPAAPKEDLIHHAVFRVLSLVLPYQAQGMDIAFEQISQTFNDRLR